MIYLALLPILAPRHDSAPQFRGRGHGELGPHHLQGNGPDVHGGPFFGQSSAEGDHRAGPRVGPPVVRQLGHHGVVRYNAKK